jgi:hypothetical protein
MDARVTESVVRSVAEDLGRTYTEQLGEFARRTGDEEGNE